MYRKLTKMPYAQACVRIDDDGTVTLISYNTEVAQINENRLYISGGYSNTTRRHISAFMREYTPFDYSKARELLDKNNYSGYRGFMFSESLFINETATYLDLRGGNIVNNIHDVINKRCKYCKETGYKCDYTNNLSCKY